MMNWIDCPRLTKSRSKIAKPPEKKPDPDLLRARSQIVSKRSAPPPKIPLKSSLTVAMPRVDEE